MTEKTKDYSIFKKSPLNRAIDPNNLKKIINSIKMHNMLELRPLIVNSNMEIIDGQHRFEAAKHLNLYIYYIIQEDSKEHDVVLLNSIQKKWSSDDYLNYYITQGNENYKFIKNICKSHEINVNTFLNLYYRTNGEGFDSFRAGKIIIENKEHLKKEIESSFDLIDEVRRIIHEKTIGPKSFLKNLSLKKALITLSSTQLFDKDLFINRLLLCLSRFHPCTKTSEYVDLFKSIYNYKNNNPLP